MKSALFVKVNVAVNTKLTSKVSFSLEISMFLNYEKFGQKRVISVWYNGKIPAPPPPCPTFQENFFRCLFQYPKGPLEAGPPPPPQSFDVSYAPDGSP